MASQAKHPEVKEAAICTTSSSRESAESPRTSKGTGNMRVTQTASESFLTQLVYPHLTVLHEQNHGSIACQSVWSKSTKLDLMHLGVGVQPSTVSQTHTHMAPPRPSPEALRNLHKMVCSLNLTRLVRCGSSSFPPK